MKHGSKHVLHKVLSLALPKMATYPSLTEIAIIEFICVIFTCSVHWIGIGLIGPTKLFFSNIDDAIPFECYNYNHHGARQKQIMAVTSKLFAMQ